MSEEHDSSIKTLSKLLGNKKRRGEGQLYEKLYL